ncbi:uncharacterized protein EI90DRAFT_3124587 [Cantharellus anzutake]|uniref:uncharacterized protein n=1 Tax=Cantharellus anzutake TaxID=1750568 RepID=UPI0019057012|nr:uncharacterized protein EI90DRAFT_3124587 [Cantharellus anzutake]KAF8330154.1 hypothetical protein EI90DRAFT_3124587 [Cantharellus anzutake]
MPPRANQAQRQRHLQTASLDNGSNSDPPFQFSNTTVAAAAAGKRRRHPTLAIATHEADVEITQDILPPLLVAVVPQSLKAMLKPGQHGSQTVMAVHSGLFPAHPDAAQARSRCASTDSPAATPNRHLTPVAMMDLMMKTQVETSHDSPLSHDPLSCNPATNQDSNLASDEHPSSPIPSHVESVVVHGVANLGPKLPVRKRKQQAEGEPTSKDATLEFWHQGDDETFSVITQSRIEFLAHCREPLVPSLDGTEQVEMATQLMDGFKYVWHNHASKEGPYENPVISDVITVFFQFKFQYISRTLGESYLDEFKNFNDHHELIALALSAIHCALETIANDKTEFSASQFSFIHENHLIDIEEFSVKKSKRWARICTELFWKMA